MTCFGNSQTLSPQAPKYHETDSYCFQGKEPSRDLLLIRQGDVCCGPREMALIFGLSDLL